MKKTVLAFGSFDILHPGHLKYLEAARKLGDRLVVLVARNDSIELFKKRKPIMDQKDRLYLISSLKIVDIAVLGAKIKKPGDAYKILLRFRPDIIALGYDQPADVPEMKAWLADHKMKTKVIRLKKQLKGKMYKSTNLKKKIAELS